MNNRKTYVIDIEKLANESSLLFGGDPINQKKLSQQQINNITKNTLNNNSNRTDKVELVLKISNDNSQNYRLKTNITNDTIKDPEKLFKLFDELKYLKNVFNAKIVHTYYAKSGDWDYNFTTIFAEEFINKFNKLKKNNSCNNNQINAYVNKYKQMFYSKYSSSNYTNRIFIAKVVIHSQHSTNVKKYRPSNQKRENNADPIYKFSDFKIPKMGNQEILKELRNIYIGELYKSKEIKSVTDIARYRLENLSNFIKHYKNFTKDELKEYYNLSKTKIDSCKSSMLNFSSKSYQECLSAKRDYWKKLYSFLNSNNNKNFKQNIEELKNLAKVEYNTHNKHYRSRFSNNNIINNKNNNNNNNNKLIKNMERQYNMKRNYNL